MCEKEYIEQLSQSLFWDMDKDKIDAHACAGHLVQRVLEYGNIHDWQLTCSYYGWQAIVDICKKMRTLDPVCLAFICCLSGTKKEEYRCCHIAL